MKPRIRKKDASKDGTNRYILEWIEDGKLCTFSLNPSKLLDSPKFRDFIKENERKMDYKKLCTNGTVSEQVHEEINNE
jgi:hypothetical protein